jgi:hypothetical protein
MDFDVHHVDGFDDDDDLPIPPLDADGDGGGTGRPGTNFISSANESRACADPAVAPAKTCWDNVARSMASIVASSSLPPSSS